MTSLQPNKKIILPLSDFSLFFLVTTTFKRIPGAKETLRKLIPFIPVIVLH